MEASGDGIINKHETDTNARILPTLEENVPYSPHFESNETRALQRVREAFSAFERIKRYQRQLTELVKADLFEETDGVVRKAENEAERLDMQCKLMTAGHQLLEAREWLEQLKRDPFYPSF